MNKWYADRLFHKPPKAWLLKTTYENNGREYTKYQNIAGLSLCATMDKEAFILKHFTPVINKMMML